MPFVAINWKMNSLVTNPTNFNTIQEFISKLKSLRLQLKDCNIEKKYEQLIYAVLSKLGESYSVFVSTFYSTRDALGEAFVIPTFDSFVERLTHEKDKIIQMGCLSSIDSKSHALVSSLPSNSRVAHKKAFKGKQRNNTK